MGTEKITMDFVNFTPENVQKAEQGLQMLCEIGLFAEAEINLKEKLIEVLADVKYMDFVPMPNEEETSSEKIIIKIQEEITTK